MNATLCVGAYALLPLRLLLSVCCSRNDAVGLLAFLDRWDLCRALRECNVLYTRCQHGINPRCGRGFDELLAVGMKAEKIPTCHILRCLPDRPLGVYFSVVKK